MGRACTVCVHPAHAAINSALDTKRSLRDIATQFGVSKTALHRHWQAHVSGLATQPTSRMGTTTMTRRGSRLWIYAKWAFALGGLLVLAAAGVRNFVKLQ